VCLTGRTYTYLVGMAKPLAALKVAAIISVAALAFIATLLVLDVIPQELARQVLTKVALILIILTGSSVLIIFIAGSRDKS